MGSAKQYVTAKKASLTDRKRIEVVILEPGATDAKGINISEDTFTRSSGRNKLWFNFKDFDSNIIRVYQNNIRKSQMDVRKDDALPGAEIIIDSKFTIQIKNK